MNYKILILAAVAFSGCASFKKAQQPTITNSFIIEKPFEDVWKNLIARIQMKGQPIKNIEKASGLIASDDMSFKSQDMTDKIVCDQYLPAGAYPVSAPGLIKMNYFVTAEGKKSTKITINTFARAQVVVAGNAYVAPQAIDLNCYSTGAVEKAIYEDLK